MDLRKLDGGLRGGDAGGYPGARKAAAATSATTITKDTPKFGKVNTVVWKGDDGRMQFRFETIRGCRPS